LTTGKETRAGNSDATWINVYYEGRKKSDRKALGKIHNHATNRDGHAILEVVGRMRTKVPANMPIILFMISDGEPSASVPDGYSGVTYTKKAVNVVEKYSNTQVIAIAIDEGIPMSDMYNTYLELTDQNKLVRDLGLILKKIIAKQQMPVTL
jgi:nitric oxide reductase activation protein